MTVSKRYTEPEKYNRALRCYTYQRQAHSGVWVTQSLYPGLLAGPRYVAQGRLDALREKYPHENFRLVSFVQSVFRIEEPEVGEGDA